MRAPPVLLCRALKEATPSRKSICAQSRRLASSGRMPEYSMSPTATSHAPLAYSSAAAGNRCISSRASTGMASRRACIRHRVFPAPAALYSRSENPVQDQPGLMPLPGSGK